MLVGIAGKVFSGKDTIGKYLCENYNFTRDAFADDLKKFAIEFFGFSKEQVFNEKSPEVREILIAIGTMFREKIAEEYWVDRVLFRHNLLISRSEKVRTVITDVRFPSEVSAIRSAGGIVIKVERPNAPKNESEVSRLQEEKYTAPIKGDFLIYSKGSIEDLHKIIDGFCNDFMIAPGKHLK
jgi:hypothetical protein